MNEYGDIHDAGLLLPISRNAHIFHMVLVCITGLVVLVLWFTGSHDS